MICEVRGLHGSKKVKVKVKVKQSHYRPEQARRVLRKLTFQDFVTTAQDGGRFQPYAPAVFTPRNYSRYSFLLGAESTPGT
jgi:hypothetical protein